MSLFRALRSIATQITHAHSLSRSIPNPRNRLLSAVCVGSGVLQRFCSTAAMLSSADFSKLTETRPPKRRPGLKNRKKRASLRPPGPYAWVKYEAGEPILTSQPNEGSKKARGRNEKKRIRQRKAFILSEKKKRKVQWAEARKRKETEKIERKMAQVAREKAWTERLIELEQIKEAKKNSASTA
ncbi:hypothetical protein LUZ60_003781 [Juncus effusus]|nr:hypothetical protein LUZ60_003781 [Juncus effusus]